MRTKDKLKNPAIGETDVLLFIIFVFAVIYGLISLVNHYEFRTYALDLGMFNQALYSFAHLNLNYFTLATDGSHVNYFADHFSLITVAFAPFYYLLHSYTLLVIQIIAILAGGVGIYMFAKHETDTKYLPLFVIFQFFGIWGIYSALAFDFHDNVVAAMLVPWLAYSYVSGKKRLFILFFLLILIAKENMALWLVFIILGLMLHRGLSHWRQFLRFEVPMLALAALYFIIVISVIMPALADENGGASTLVARYSEFGNSPAAIARNIVLNPQKTFSLLFQATRPNKDHGDDKYGLHAAVLASGGLALLAVPSCLVMLIPVYLQKFLTVDPSFWGITGQYSIEFVPIIGIAFTTLLAMLKRRRLGVRWQYLVAALFLVTTYGSLSYTIANRKLSDFSQEDNVNFLATDHYTPSVKVNEVNQFLDSIPAGVPLSASSSLAPHLGYRNQIYQYPIIRNSEYIVIMQDPRDNFIDPALLPAARNFVMLLRTNVSNEPARRYLLMIYKRKS